LELLTDSGAGFSDARTNLSKLFPDALPKFDDSRDRVLLFPDEAQRTIGSIPRFRQEWQCEACRKRFGTK